MKFKIGDEVRISAEGKKYLSKLISGATAKVIDTYISSLDKPCYVLSNELRTKDDTSCKGTAEEFLELVEKKKQKTPKSEVDAPKGYEYTGEHRPPITGEYYLDIGRKSANRAGGRYYYSDRFILKKKEEPEPKFPAPKGYEYTGEFRIPHKGECYTFMEGDRCFLYEANHSEYLCKMYILKKKEKFTKEDSLDSWCKNPCKEIKLSSSMISSYEQKQIDDYLNQQKEETMDANQSQLIRSLLSAVFVALPKWGLRSLLWSGPKFLTKSLFRFSVADPFNNLKRPAYVGGGIVTFLTLIAAICYAGYFTYNNTDRVVDGVKSAIPTVNISWEEPAEETVE